MEKRQILRHVINDIRYWAIQGQNLNTDKDRIEAYNRCMALMSLLFTMQIVTSYDKTQLLEKIVKKIIYKNA